MTVQLRPCNPSGNHSCNSISSKVRLRAKFIGWSLLLLCISLISSCNSTTTGQTGTATTNADVALVTVDMHDNYYGASDDNLANPPVWSVQAGADVVATLTNHGRRNHNWAIVKPGASIPVPYKEGQGGAIILHGIGMVYGNSQTTITFTAPEPGEYMVICTVDGHYPEMQGRLLITAPNDQ